MRLTRLEIRRRVSNKAFFYLRNLCSAKLSYVLHESTEVEKGVAILIWLWTGSGVDEVESVTELREDVVGLESDKVRIDEWGQDSSRG